MARIRPLSRSLLDSGGGPPSEYLVAEASEEVHLRKIGLEKSINMKHLT
jgi:hypothetical protein